MLEQLNRLQRRFDAAPVRDRQPLAHAIAVMIAASERPLVYVPDVMGLQGPRWQYATR